MIVVDSSVWIDHLRDTTTTSVRHLRQLIPLQQVIVGDLVLCEVLRGVESEARARRVEASMRAFELVSLCQDELAVKAARNYRILRTHGFTVRSTVDLIIGTFCIERGHALLHSDRDFEPMERFLGLRTA